MEELKPRPKQLATWALAGAFLATSSYLLVFVPIPRLPSHGHGLWALLWMNRLRFVAFFTPLALGLAISQVAERRFNRGFHDDLWSEAELEPVKALVANPIWRWASLILCCFGLLAMIFSNNPKTHFSGILFYVFLVPTQTAMRIRQLVTSRVKTTGVFRDWKNVKPIRSDHWGQQPIPPSE
ncbi:hypothetical protein [Granulicella sp. S190]|uniref:hypothetical protein n=1 Tax=Granulicella sp. S190 TaxID=1747226 RepID=UPI00131C913B|nr:hypothetical protein [Granulicella sp. S190]